jgi:hypothetical protein
MQFAASHGWSQITQAWNNAHVSRVVYCTARVDGAQNPSAHTDQDIYLKAFVATSSVDHIEYGNYVARVKVAPLAVKSTTSMPQLVTSKWPVMIKDQNGNDVPNAAFLCHTFTMKKKAATSTLRHIFLSTSLIRR